MFNTKLFYSYKDTENTGKVPLTPLSSYSGSIIFDEDNRRLWHNGKQYGNTYWGTKHGETFNDLDTNYAYDYAHAEGISSYAAGEASHVEGNHNRTYGDYSHAEGNYTVAYGNSSHAEGEGNVAHGDYSHVEGEGNITYGEYSHVEGESNVSHGFSSHAEGTENVAYGDVSHAEGKHNTSYAEYSHTEGATNTAYGIGSHVEGRMSLSYGSYSHAEGFKNIAYGNYSHAEGWVNLSYSSVSHTEGANNIAYGVYSHVEGRYNASYGSHSHVEGDNNVAYGNFSHAEGENNTAYGNFSHTEGDTNTAYGSFSHAEGQLTFAKGLYSHTQGLYTIAHNDYEAAFGRYNESISDKENSTIYSIGNGSSPTERHNIIDFRQNGDMHKNGNSYFHDNIYGPVSYTYVNSLGEDATLDIILSSLLTAAEYKKPSYTFKFRNGETGPEYGKVTNDGSTNNIIEVGSIIDLYLNLNLSNYNTEHNTDGLSYGLSYCRFSHGGVNYEYTELGIHGLGTTYPFNNEGSYSMTDGKPISLCYLKSSYQGYPQLLDKGVYVPSKENWYNDSMFKMDDYKITAQYKYYYGWDADISSSSFTPRNGTAVWLPIIRSGNTTTTSNISFNTSHTSFWFAIPIDVVDKTTTSGFEVLYHTSIGDADLVSTSATVTTKEIPISLPGKTHQYLVTKVDFNKTISGASSNYVKFTMVKK